MNNVQRMLRLQGGAAGEWKVRAELCLAELLGKPIVMKSGVCEDKKPLAIQHKKPLVIKEQDMIQRRMNLYSGFEKVQDYIAQVNGEIEGLLLEHTPIPWLPLSPESESPSWYGAQ